MCRLFLYDEPRCRSLMIDEIAGYIKNMFPKLDVCCRGDFIHHHLVCLTTTKKEKAFEDLAREWANLRVANPESEKGTIRQVLPAEINYEKRRLKDLHSPTAGILYQGPELLLLLTELLPPQERTLKNVHVIFTNQLFATWSREDCRYHARVSVYWHMNLISTTGVVVAPARSREYYFLQRTYASLGIHESLKLNSELMQDCLTVEDPRLTEVLKGYVAQAIFYHFTGNPFCENPICRLYNAHWQKELITAQLSGAPEFCPRHQKELLF